MTNLRIDRRHFLSLGMVAAGAAIMNGNVWPQLRPRELAVDTPRWSDPATWGGQVPGPKEWVSLDRTVVLDMDAQVRGLAIQPGGALVFDPDTTRTLTSTANIVVLGLLQMRPSSAAVNHTIRFVGVDESRFVGGGMDVLDSDVGLWCLHQGVLDLAGTVRRAWARTASSVPVGSRTITLQADPIGWQPGDSLAIVPSDGPETANHHDAYDYATIVSISGRTITLSTPTRFAHPVVNVGRDILVAPEVLNLTRNVNIEGTSEGRAHIFVMPSRTQHMSYFAARWMGPRQPDGSTTKSVLGRYGLHLHMARDHSRGSRIEGAVLRDIGAHAYAIHASHGVTLTSCISHDTLDDAYWWDPPPERLATDNDSHDVVYDSCVASRVQSVPSNQGYRLCGFNMKQGERNVARDCIAVGVQGNKNASGFHWPEGHQGIWDFERCISHNNKVNGIFTWQNNENVHVVRDFICYHNGKAGIEHGAYVTQYTYSNGYLFRNRTAAIELHSNSHSGISQRFLGVHCECVSDYAVVVLKHRIETSVPTQFIGCSFNGQTHSAIGMASGTSQGSIRELFDIVDCESSSNLLWLRDDTHPDSVIRIQDASGAVVATPVGTPVGTPGTFRGEWNAMVSDIAPFSTETTQPGAITVVHGAIVPGTSSPAPSPPDTSTSTTTTAPETTSTTTTTTTAPPETTSTTTTTAPETTTTTTTPPEAEPIFTGPAKSNSKAQRGDDPKPGNKGNGKGR